VKALAFKPVFLVFFVLCVGQVLNSPGVHLLMEMSLCLLFCLSFLLQTSLSPTHAASVIPLLQRQVARSQQASVRQQSTGSSVPAGTSQPPCLFSVPPFSQDNSGTAASLGQSLAAVLQPPANPLEPTPSPGSHVRHRFAICP